VVGGRLIDASDGVGAAQRERGEGYEDSQHDEDASIPAVKTRVARADAANELERQQKQIDRGGHDVGEGAKSVLQEAAIELGGRVLRSGVGGGGCRGRAEEDDGPARGSGESDQAQEDDGYPKPAAAFTSGCGDGRGISGHKYLILEARAKCCSESA